MMAGQSTLIKLYLVLDHVEPCLPLPPSGRHGGLTVSALDSGVSRPGWAQGHCVVFLVNTLYSYSASLLYKWVLANIMLGVNLQFSVFTSHVMKTKYRNHSMNKVKNLRYDRWLIHVYKQPRQESGLCRFSFPRYLQKCVTQIYRALYGDAMFVPFWGAQIWRP